MPERAVKWYVVSDFGCPDTTLQSELYSTFSFQSTCNRRHRRRSLARATSPRQSTCCRHHSMITPLTLAHVARPVHRPAMPIPAGMVMPTISPCNLQFQGFYGFSYEVRTIPLSASTPCYAIILKRFINPHHKHTQVRPCPPPSPCRPSVRIPRVRGGESVFASTLLRRRLAPNPDCRTPTVEYIHQSNPNPARPARIHAGPRCSSPSQSSASLPARLPPPRPRRSTSVN